MPELLDITVYVERLAALVGGKPLERVRVASPFVVRSFDPPLSRAHGRGVEGVRRLGKRIVLDLEGELFLVVHLMIAGRLKWRERNAKIPGKVGLLALDFESGAVLLTEASTKKRAWVRLVAGRSALDALDPGGLEVLDADFPAFDSVLKRENHTLKRALTDPTLFSGIGNAYSDEILHAAGLSPVKLTSKMTGEESRRLFEAVRKTLVAWTERLRAEAGDGLPEKVTAFREGMAVHGRFGEPCPLCKTPVQRIAYAENETNYCPTCQTGGRLLADRALSRLLREDWPRSLEEMEERKKAAEGPAPPVGHRSGQPGSSGFGDA